MMKTDLFILLLCSALTGAMTFLLENAKCAKFFRYLSLLVLLAAFIIPVKKLLTNDFSLMLNYQTAEEGDYNEYARRLAEETEKQTERTYSALIQSKTGLTDEDFSLKINVICHETDLEIESISCILNTFSALSFREEISKILSELGRSVCFIENL